MAMGLIWPGGREEIPGEGRSEMMMGLIRSGGGGDDEEKRM